MPTKQGQRKGQFVFKVDLKTSDCLDVATTLEKTVHPRRPHKKSRGGCLECKRKKVKCDETKPQCKRCLDYSTNCRYTVTREDASPSLDTSEEVTSQMYSMAVDQVASNLDDLLHHPMRNGSSYTEMSNIRILQHFLSFTSITLGPGPLEFAMHSTVINKAWDHPFLMHTALAVSVAHLRCLQADAGNERPVRHSATEAYHWQRGLQLYQNELRAREHDADAIVATTILTTIYTHALDSSVPHGAGDEEAFADLTAPMAAASGFRALGAVLGSLEPSTAWTSILEASDDPNGMFTNLEPGIEGLPPAFVSLCNLTASSTPENNPYHSIVRQLTPLLQLDLATDESAAIKVFAYGGRTWRSFRPLLSKRDPIALLLLSYWFTRLIQTNRWWPAQRAKIFCANTVAYLSQLQEPRLRALLLFPASSGASGLSPIWADTP